MVKGVGEALGSRGVWGISCDFRRGTQTTRKTVRVKGKAGLYRKSLRFALNLVTKTKGKGEKTLSVVAKPGSSYGNLVVDWTRT